MLNTFKTFFFTLIFLGLMVKAHASTNNILLIGYWPPTNQMMTNFSPFRSKNLRGWVGHNWMGSGYNVYAYFPQYKGKGDFTGTGRFAVDFASVYEDFMDLTEQLRPVAILGFGSGGGIGWTVETIFPAHYYKSFASENLHSSVGVRISKPVPESLKLPIVRATSLPVEKIVNAVNAATSDHLTAEAAKMPISDYVCGFTAYLAAWYHDEHRSPEDPYHNITAGFIHVNGGLTAARGSLTPTLKAIIEHLNDAKASIP